MSERENVESVNEEIEIDGESFHIEEFEPTEGEYRELVDGIYRGFYELDMKASVEAAINQCRDAMRKEIQLEMQKKEEEIKAETKKEILKKITQRRLRPDENGLSVQSKAQRKDVSKMTKEERAAAAKKAAGGLIINFK